MDLNALAINYNKKRPVINGVKNDLTEIFSSWMDSNAESAGGSNFLDVGCGAGQISEFILSFSEKWKVVGIDITETMIRQCLLIKEGYGERCDFITMDINEEYESICKLGPFDFLVFSQSIHFMESEAMKYLIYKCLKKGGNILIITTLPSDLKEIPYCIISKKVLDFEQKRLLDLSDIDSIFPRADFEMCFNKRVVLTAKLEGIKEYYLSKPFSALTILSEDELLEAINSHFDLLSRTEVLDIFNVIVLKKLIRED